MFIVTLTYLVPADVIADHRAAHRAFLDRYYEEGLFLASGPMTAGGGGIIVVSTHVDAGRLEGLLREDPFHELGLAQYAITAFDAVKHAPALAPYA